MKKSLKAFLLTGFVLIAITSCTSINRTMREPNTKVQFYRKDFTLSEQVVGEAKTVKILYIDFKRFFTKKTGTIDGGSAAISVASIPIIGNAVADQTVNYALYELMKANPGYDVVFYPQYKTKIIRPILGLGFLTKITTAKVTARLGRLNDEVEVK